MVRKSRGKSTKSAAMILVEEFRLLVKGLEEAGMEKDDAVRTAGLLLKLPGMGGGH